MMDSLLSTAYPEHRSPRLAQFIFQAYHMTGSATIANSLSHLGLGIGASRFTRRHGPASQAGTSDSKLETKFEGDVAFGFDNAAHQDRHVQQRRADYHPPQHHVCLAPAYTLADDSKNTGAQRLPKDAKPLSDAPLSVLQLTEEERKLLASHRQESFAAAMADALLATGGRVSQLSGFVCGSTECPDTEVHQQDPGTCDDCEEQTMRPLSEFVRNYTRQHEPRRDPVERKAPTHVEHPQPVIHQHQSVDVQRAWMEERIQKGKQDAKARGEVCQWLALFGDATTVEYAMKAAERAGWQQEWLVYLGLLHEYIYMGKSTIELLRDFGGPELFAAAGWKTLRAQDVVRCTGIWR